MPKARSSRAKQGAPAHDLGPFVARTAAGRERAPALVDVTLDPAQRAAIELEAGRPLLVLGEAGHGKTTVLLHRVARLWQRERAALRAAVLVPSEGLARLIAPLLGRLGADVDVLTFDAFAARQARKAFKRLPKENDGAPAAVMRLKRCAELAEALAVLARREPGMIDDDRDGSRRQVWRHVSRGDLQHLFGDRLLMERVARAARLPAHAVDETLERTRVQFSPRAEREWSHVTDRRRLIAVDRRALDEGTASAHAATVDADDYAVLFELDRLRAKRRRQRPTEPEPYDLLAVDEAQELSALELSLVRRSLATGGTLVVAGDADQHTGDTTFAGWEAVMRALGAARHATATLEIGYRCPPEVVALAREVRDGTGAGATRDLAFASEAELAADLGRAMAALLADDPRASVAVICRQPRTARRLAPLLAGEVATRLVFDGRFRPRGAVQVSIVTEMKGLEFDYVLVPDASASDWPDDPLARRALYVAVTRARHQVVLARTGELTPLVRGS